jgi:transcriptional regulator with GAF, ATPase, and Fis domain
MMIGGSAAIIAFSKQIARIARTPGMRAFITGETGTGKEVVARTIHEISRCSGPFRAVNCAATVEGLLESDLFGHEKGAFTDAYATKKGFWEEAAGGLFLDEITEASLTVQAKLLRALQEGLIRRVGSNQEIKVATRVIAASYKDIEKAVKDGTFRQDLYYRLGQAMRLPPLRERRKDMPELIENFRRRAMKETVFTPEAIDALCDYDWLGNMREIESVIQRIIAFSGRFVFREDVLLHIKLEDAGDDTA